MKLGMDSDSLGHLPYTDVLNIAPLGIAGLNSVPATGSLRHTSMLSQSSPVAV